MTIDLSPEQERAIREAIHSGLIGSVEEFIDGPSQCFPMPKIKPKIPVGTQSTVWKSSRKNIVSAWENPLREGCYMKAIATNQLPRGTVDK